MQSKNRTKGSAVSRKTKGQISRPTVLRRLGAILGALSIVAAGSVGFSPAASATSTDPNADHKITLCHRTGSADGGNQHNGYDIITVDIAASGYVEGGHTNHDQVGNGPGPDIIPAYDAYAKDKGVWQPFSFPGKGLSYVFADGTTGAEFLANGCNYNRTTVTPVAPTLTDPTCDAGQTIVLPTTEGVIYTINKDNSVTATPADGYKFDGEAQSVTYGPYDLQGPLSCPMLATPVPPTITDPTCTSGSTIVLPDTEGVIYTINTDHSVTATPAEGYHFAGSQTVTYGPYDLQGPLSCPMLATPVPPTITDPTCTSGSTIVLPDTEGVIYKIVTHEGHTYVVASPAKGYYFANEARYVKYGPFQLKPALDCTQVVSPVAPTLVLPTCDAPGSVTVPTIEGVIYKDNKDGTWTATPKEGYRFDGESQSVTYSVGIPAGQLTCTTPAGPGPANPQANVQATCAQAEITLMNLTSQVGDTSANFEIDVNGKLWKAVNVKGGDTQEITYKATSNPYTVAVLVGGTKIDSGTTANQSCVEAVVIPGQQPPAVAPAVVPAAAPAELPHTGANPLPTLLGGVGLLLLGSLLVASTYRRRGDLAA